MMASNHRAMRGKVWGAGVTALESTRRARLARMRDYNRSIRRLALSAYGSECECCGLREEAFLTIDHIDGAAHHRYRQAPRAGTELFHWLRREAFPRGFRVMCWNCNNAVGHYGRCPHSDRRRARKAARKPRSAVLAKKPSRKKRTLKV